MHLDLIEYDVDYEQKDQQPYWLRLIVLIIVIVITIVCTLFSNFWIGIFLSLIFYCLIDFIYRVYKGV